MNTVKNKNGSIDEFNDEGRLIKRTYLDGTIFEFNSSINRRLVTKELLSDGTVHEFDDYGVITKTTYHNGTVQEYDEYGDPTFVRYTNNETEHNEQKNIDKEV
jgi:hypothetical protein